jgi:C1A family cysteine protease
VKEDEEMETLTRGVIVNLSPAVRRTQSSFFGFCKYALLVLVACVCSPAGLAAGGPTASPSATLSIAPVNPEFVAWQSKAATFNLELRDAEGHTLGLIPSPIDRSHLLTQTRVPAAQLEGLPPSYDLRTYGYVTPVKNQGGCGSCGAFASYGSLESWLLKNAAETWDFSENHLKNYHGFDYTPCEGCSADMSTAYLARWSGPVSEADDPYHDYDDRPSPGGPCRKYLERVLWFFTASDIKNALMTYGGLYVTMYMDSAYYNSSQYTYYYNGSNGANHAITLVGWDDNKVVTGAPGNGAWLLKNSWGTNWGDSGYFWISYYDSVAVQSAVAFCNAVSTLSYVTNYQYDPLGWTSATGYDSTTAWAANIFTATSNEQLKAVGLYAVANNVSYEIYVYDTFNGNTFSNLLGSVSGTLSNSGYHTVQLASPINLTTGNDFSIVVKFTSPGYNYPVSIETDIAGYSSGANASPGQSYISSDGGGFTDITTYYSNTNVCIKAFVRLQYTITASAGSNGVINPNGTFVKNCGENQQFEAIPETGYMVDKWYLDGNLAQTGGLIYTLNNIQADAIVLVNFKPTVVLTMSVSPSEAGITVPAIGTNEVAKNEAISISAQSNAGYSLMSWTAIPAENVVFGNANAPSTTAILSGNAIVTANFNAKPVADINATVNVLVITDANSVTLDATGSTDDGLPNPPGIMTYHWEKVSGPNTCNILDPNIAVTGVLFWGLGSYEFSVTVSDGQLQDVESATVDVVVDVAYVASDGDDNTGLGTIENPFATIQRGMDVVRDDGTVIVLTGTYYENIDFGGRKIMVKSVNPDDPSVVANTVIDANGSGSVVTFNSGEDANSVLAGFTITGGDTTLGGGIYIDGASPIIEKNVITSNSASSEGGGIYCQGGSAMIRYNKISNNYSSFVGGVSFESSFAVLQNNLIVDNTADYDSGVACLEGQPRIVNNTIAGNVSVYDNDSSGLLIASFSLSPIISNNIIAFNYGAPGVVDFGGFDPNYFSYNDVYGHPNGNYLSWVLPTPDQTGVNGNISVNPLFADTDANDYHLLPESLLIDAGDLSSDWSNEPRPNGGRINMGAYGNTSEASCSLAGDITWDKKVDFKDFAKLAFYWLQNEPSVDIAPLVSGDNIVDVGDLAVLAEHWLEGI